MPAGLSRNDKKFLTKARARARCQVTTASGGCGGQLQAAMPVVQPTTGDESKRSKSEKRKEKKAAAKALVFAADNDGNALPAKGEGQGTNGKGGPRLCPNCLNE